MKLENKRIFLTGGAGFIGSILSEKLSGKNEIIVYDIFKRDSLKYKNINKKNTVVINGSILDYIKLKKTCEKYKPEIVIHLAAIAGVDTVIKNPVNTMKTNMIGTYYLLEAIRKYSNRLIRVANFSTSEVLGAYSYKKSEKSDTNLAPVGEARWTYSISKVSGEHLMHSYFKEFSYPVVTIRPFNIYGPGQIGEGAIQIFIKNAVKNKTIEIHGDGDQIRSWCYIDDMLDGIMLCLTKKQAVGEIFNIGNPKGTITISSLAEKIITLCNTKSKIKYVPKNYVDVELRIPSIEKAETILGYHPKVNLNEGIVKTFDWYKKYLL
jgi:dTDP-glucose 4,6-dehydratase